MIVQRNLVLLNDPSQVFPLLNQGFKVILCTEDPVPPEILSHPNTLKASILLPPYGVLSLELNGDIPGMECQYVNYLMTDVNASSLLDLIVLAALMGNPLALCFGSEINDLHFYNPLMFYIENNLGLHFDFGGYGSVDEMKSARAVESLTLKGEITPMQGLSFYPLGMDFSPTMLSYLYAALHPPVDATNYTASNDYFKAIVQDMKGQFASRYGQQYYCPFEAGPKQGDA